MLQLYIQCIFSLTKYFTLIYDFLHTVNLTPSHCVASHSLLSKAATGGGEKSRAAGGEAGAGDVDMTAAGGGEEKGGDEEGEELYVHPDLDASSCERGVWYKFDDDRVDKSDFDGAAVDNYGGEYPGVARSGSNNSNNNRCETGLCANYSIFSL